MTSRIPECLIPYVPKIGDVNIFRQNIAKNAQRMINAGFSIIPLTGKVPIVKKWKEYSFELNSFLYSDLPSKTTGFGIACGEKSKTFAIDVDIGKSNKKSGLEWWNRITRLCYQQPGELSEVPVFNDKGCGYGTILLPVNTYTQRTGSGGYHIFYKYEPTRMGDIANNGVGDVSIDIKTNGGYVVGANSVHPNGHLYEAMTGVSENGIALAKCPALLLDHIRGNREKKKTNNRNVTTTSKLRDDWVPNAPSLIKDPNSKEVFTYEAINYLISLLNPRRAEDYHSWRDGIWAIQETVKAQDWAATPEELYQIGLGLAQKFSSLCVHKYDSNATRGLWEDAARKLPPDNPITLGTLRMWAKEDNYQGYIMWMRTCNAINTRRCYDPDDTYCLLDYIEDVANQVFESSEEANEFCLEKLERFIRVICYNKMQFVVRLNERMTHRIINERPEIQYSPFCCYYKVYSKKSEEPVIQKMNIFNPLYNLKLCCNDIRFFPMYPGEDDSEFRKCGLKSINIFPGFLAKREKTCVKDKIKLLLKHIREIVCGKDKDLYRYIIRWLAYAIQYPRRHQPALVLVGEEGCGKTTICNFLIDYIYGSQISNTEACMDGISHRFNGSLENCCLYVINEAVSVDKKNYKGIHAKLNALVADRKIMIERKGQERYQTVNYAKFIITTNDRNAIKIKGDDRHFVIVDCASTYRNNKEYFDALYASFDQEMANHFFTFLLEKDLSGFDVNTIPMTKIRSQIIVGDDGTVDEYLGDILKGEWMLGANLRTRQMSFTTHRPELDGKDHIFVPSEDLKADHMIWCDTNRIETKIKGKKFTKVLINKFPKAHTQQKINSQNRNGFFIDLIGLCTVTQCDIPVENGYIPTIPITNDGGCPAKSVDVCLTKSPESNRISGDDLPVDIEGILLGTFEVTHVTGSSAMKGNWKNYWESRTRVDFDKCECSIMHCIKTAEVGAHVYIKGINIPGICFIIPMCGNHNLDRNFNYILPHVDNWVSTKMRTYAVCTKLDRRFYEATYV